MKKLWIAGGALVGAIALCVLGLWYKEKEKNEREEYLFSSGNSGISWDDIL